MPPYSAECLLGAKWPLVENQSLSPWRRKQRLRVGEDTSYRPLHWWEGPHPSADSNACGPCRDSVKPPPFTTDGCEVGWLSTSSSHSTKHTFALSSFGSSGKQTSGWAPIRRDQLRELLGSESETSTLTTLTQG